MPQIARHIVDNSSPVLVLAQNPNGVTVSFLSLCNTAAGEAIISLSKVWNNDATQTFYKVKDIALAPKTTFVWEAIPLPGGWSINLTMTTGTIDLILIYSVNMIPV